MSTNPETPSGAQPGQEQQATPGADVPGGETRDPRVPDKGDARPDTSEELGGAAPSVGP